MEWYVIRHEFNSDKIEMWNIFNHWKFEETVEELLDNYVDFDDFVENLSREIRYYFWSKVEYEVEIAGMFSKNDKVEKWDVSMQLLPNIKALAQYIINFHNENY